MKKILFLAACYFITLTVTAQNSSNYSITTTTDGDLTKTAYADAIAWDMPGANSLYPVNINNFFQADVVRDIPFPFAVMGKFYDRIHISIDGMVGLSLSNPAALFNQTGGSNYLSRPIQYPPVSEGSSAIIAPFWDVLKTSPVSPTIRTVTAGTRGQRCMVVEWQVLINSSSTTANVPDAVFQLRLYEKTGVIEMVYGKMNIGNVSFEVTASIGIGSGTTDNSGVHVSNLNPVTFSRGADDGILINSAMPGPITGLNSTVEGQRVKFTFTPVQLNGDFINSNVTNIGPREMTLNWSDNFTNKLGYVLMQGDSVSGSLYNQWYPPNTNSITLNGLTPNTRYKYRLLVFTEGNIAKEIAFNDSTRCRYNGTYSIGSTGNFATIKIANDSLKRWGVGGNVIMEWNSSYSPNSETYPVRINYASHCEAVNPLSTVTFQPAGSVSSLSFIQNNAAPVFILDSAKNIILNGKNNSGITVVNLQNIGTSVELLNASKCVVNGFNIRSSNTSDTMAAIKITGSLTSVQSKADSIRNNIFTNINAGVLPVAYISSAATSTAGNDGIVIEKNEFVNAKEFAIIVRSRAVNWVIKNNSFYATTPVTSDSANAAQVCIKDNQTDNFPDAHQILNNSFGGSNATAGGNVMQITAAKNYSLISVNESSNINYNIFKRIAFNCTNNSSFYPASMNIISTSLDGIRDIGFSSNPYRAIGNKIGDNQPGDSISFVNNGTVQNGFNAISHGMNRYITADSNIIRHIKVADNGQGAATFRAIAMAPSGNSASYNKLGDPLPVYGIQCKGSSSCMGIAAYTSQVNYNDIQNFRNTGEVVAISNNNGSAIGNTITGIVRIRDDIGRTTSGYTGEAIGIRNYNNALVSNNRLVYIADSAAQLSAYNKVAALTFYQGSATASRNFIDAVMFADDTTAFRSVSAITSEETNLTCENNFVRVGVDTFGNTVSSSFFSCFSNGAYVGYPLLRHNTFVVAGDNVPEGSNTSKILYTPYSAGIFNNIFVMKRSMVDTTAKNLIYSTDGFTENFQAYNNIYWYDSLKIRFASGSSSYPSLTYFQTFSGKDLKSLVYDPNIINYNGPTSQLNLHLNSPTIAERRGVSFNTSTTDFDGETRSITTPVDIGADAGNFVPVDIDAPAIILRNFTTETDTAAVYNVKASITDTLYGVRDTGIYRPVIWYRKISPAISGWQFAYGTRDSGDIYNGRYNFYIDHALINAVNRDSVQYYIVAQDNYSVANIGYSIAGKGWNSNTITQLTPPSVAHAYRLFSRLTLADTLLIGSGYDYTTLTGDAGVFESLKKDSVNSNITIKIMSSTNEPGIWGIDSTLGKRNIAVKIIPGADSVIVVKNAGNLNTSMIKIDGSKNITIDGSFGSSKERLLFINTNIDSSKTTSIIEIKNGARDISISNIKLQGNNYKLNTNASILVGAGNTVSALYIKYNSFSQPDNTTANYGYGILFSGATDSAGITGNSFVNYSFGGVMINAKTTNLLADSNHFYRNLPSPLNTTLAGIALTGISNASSSGSSGKVSYNYFGGSDKFAVGNTWIHTGTLGSIQPFAVNGTFTISNNKVAKFSSTGSSSNFYGITSLLGRTEIFNNIIGDSSTPDNIIINSNSVQGIYVGGKSTITGNIIGGINCINTTFSANIIGIWDTGDSVIISNNRIRNLTGRAYGTSTSPMVGGIYAWGGTHCIVANNTISDLYALATSKTEVTGLQLFASAGLGGTATGNRIYNLFLDQNTSGKVQGISVEDRGQWNVFNNAISLTASGINQSSVVYGIEDTTNNNPGQVSNYAYNTVVLSGPANTPCFAFQLTGNGQPSLFKNNLLINQMSSSAAQGALKIKSGNTAAQWVNSRSNNNLYIVKDTAAVNSIGTTMINMDGWRNATGKDDASYVLQASMINADSILLNWQQAAGSVNTGNRCSWYINGKAQPLPLISTDIFGNARSNALAKGAADIGAGEFNTSTLPIPLTITGNHSPGSSENLIQAGRTIAVINWRNTGALPVLNSPRWYSGNWPNDSTNGNTYAGIKFLNAYCQIPVSGGSGYGYDIALFYDSSIMGKIASPSSAVLCKKQIGVNGTWQNFTEESNASFIVQANNLTSFGEISAIDGAVSATDSSSVCPDGNTAIQSDVTGQSYQWQVDNGSGFANISNNIMYSGASTASLVLSNVPSSYSGYRFRCQVGFTYSKVFVIRFTNEWIGAISDAWENPANWSCGAVPDANTDVNINGAFNVVLSSNTIIKTLQLKNGAALTISPGFNLTIQR